LGTIAQKLSNYANEEGDVFLRRGTATEEGPPDGSEHRDPRLATRRVLSKPFIIAAITLGSLGFAVPALAGGPTTGGPTVYYAQTGLDGVIHCAGSYVYLGTGGGMATVETETYVQKDLYCVNADSYPNSYFAAASDLVDDQYQVCQSTPWKWNTSPSGVWASWSWAESTCSSSRYFAIGFSQAEVNLGWRDNNISVNSWVSP
jgi:hypothetical protein